MKIALWSDLHLEFHDFEPVNQNEADVLILGGDICMATAFTRSEPSPYAKKAEKYKNFFGKCGDLFERVFYNIGNHEHYRGEFEETTDILKAQLPDNVILLENEGCVYNGINWFGTTLWTNPGVYRWTVEDGINDYRLITHEKRRLRVTDTIKYHEQAVAQIADLPHNTIVMGHHAPSERSIDEKYKHLSHLNPAYYTDLEHLMGDHIPLWTHGHVHSPFDYNVNGTRVVANPRGYPGENPEFDPNLIIEV